MNEAVQPLMRLGKAISVMERRYAFLKMATAERDGSVTNGQQRFAKDEIAAIQRVVLAALAFAEMRELTAEDEANLARWHRELSIFHDLQKYRARHHMKDAKFFNHGEGI